MSSETLRKLRRKALPLALLVLLLLVFALSVASLSLQEWVSLGHDDFLIEGGLVRCSHCPESMRNQWYHDIASSNYCSASNPSMSGICELIDDLNIAGILFIVSELLAVLALLGWVSLLAGKVLGAKPSNWLLYATAGSATFMHVFGVLAWMGVSEARYDDCRDLRFNGDRPNVCITVGPTLALVSTCLYALCVSMLIILLYNRHPSLQQAEVPSTTMRFTFGNMTEMSESKV